MTWYNWAILVLAVILILSPFLFGFADVAVALWTAVIIGLLVAVLSLVPAFTRSAAGPRM